MIALTRSRSPCLETASRANSSTNFKRRCSRRNSACTSLLSPANTVRRISRRACKDSTLVPSGNSLWSAQFKEASVMFAFLAKAVLIVVCPFVILAQDCPANFNPRQLLKGDRLHKNDKPGALFGVAEETLLGKDCSTRWESIEWKMRGFLMTLDLKDYADFRDCANRTPLTNNEAEAKGPEASCRPVWSDISVIE